LDSEPMVNRASWHGSSGNGAYALVRVDLANTDNTIGMVDAFIGSLATKYRTDGACIDDQWDATRKIGLPGSLKCKGPDRPDRPRRAVTIERMGEAVEVFDVQTWLAANSVPIKPPRFHVPSGQTGLTSFSRTGRTENDFAQAREWLRNRSPAISGESGRKHTFRTIATVLHGWDLSPQDTLTLISEWNVTNVPAWTASELSEKVDDVTRTNPFKEPGYMRSHRNRCIWGNTEWGD
jgi:hypothetical protein